MNRFAIVAGVLLLLAIVPVGKAQKADLAFIETRAEATNYRETTRYDELMAFLEVITESSDDLLLTSFGYSVEGRSLPLVIFGQVRDDRPSSILASGQTRVFVFANIHGGEVEGKEAVLMMLRAMAEGRYDHLLDSLVVLFAPIYNADGNERISLFNRPRQHGPLGGMGERANAQGLDLNRDHMKLETPEARSMVALLNAYDPHLVVDLHSTNGTHHGYHLTYAPPLHPATAGEITNFLRGEWLPTITSRARGQFDLDFYYYGNLPWPGMDAPRGWYTFDHRPRFNNNYVGLRNRLAILSEAYAYLPFRDRVEVTRIFTDEVLTFASDNATRIRMLTDTLDTRSVVGEELAVRADFERSDSLVTILMGAVAEEVHPYTGEIIYRRLDLQRAEELFEYGTFRPTETEVVPEAYFLPGDQWKALELLQTHGIQVDVLEEPTEGEVERFRIDSTYVAERPFQQHHERTIVGKYERREMEIPARWYRIDMDQPLARLAFKLLEPRSDDGLLNWNVFDEALEEARYYPVWRFPARAAP